MWFRSEVVIIEIWFGTYRQNGTPYLSCFFLSLIELWLCKTAHLKIPITYMHKLFICIMQLSWKIALFLDLSYCIHTHTHTRCLGSLRCVWSGNEKEVFAVPISNKSFRDLILPHEMERQSDNRPVLHYTSWIFTKGSVLSIQIAPKLAPGLGSPKKSATPLWDQEAGRLLFSRIVFVIIVHLNN